MGITPIPALLGIRQDSGNGLPEGACTKDIPCANQACCNGDTGVCGFDKADHCGPACTSKCDSRAECGPHAEIPGQECPIHVCCSKHGYCGTVEDFCGDGCQSNCGEPTKTSPHTTDVRDLVIGYVEGWAFTREGCAGRDVYKDLHIDSVTHLFVSFGYIKPDSFEVYPMQGVTDENILAMTGFKERAPGLKVWIALGGWSFSDNGTDTQAVWADLASTAEKRMKFLVQLEKFMVYYGFDGVDYDWEYPGAGDRGGNKEDGKNYVELVKATRAYFKDNARGWGISFTAPSSYWYLRHFEIGAMMEHVDFVNLMTYDLFGSWDDQSDWIGPHVYGHTNLTVIKNALSLLWRNGVPANQVNLGLGFYGRTYTLEDPSCDRPGCGFSGPGNKGFCSGEAGYMSYQDIERVLKMSHNPVVTDEKETVNYFRYDDDQWVSYDDENTIKAKVEFANEQGLRGLFIWAVTQDTAGRLLDAVLQPDGLGKFKERNGVQSEVDPWETRLGDKCAFSDCGEDCPNGHIELTSIRCEKEGDSSSPRKKLCCPFGSAPDPQHCKWRANKNGIYCGNKPVGSSPSRGNALKCEDGEQKVASDKWFVNDQGDDEMCSYTEADYCCDEYNEDVCAWSNTCTAPGDSEISCPRSGMQPLLTENFKGIAIGGCDVTTEVQSWDVLCCEASLQPECRWVADMDPEKHCAAECSSDEVNYGRHDYGGGEDCEDKRWPRNGFYQFGENKDAQHGRLLCCKKNSVRVKHKNLPVPLDHLFDTKIEDTDEQTFDIDVDYDGKSDSSHPNDGSFGWHIMSGPPDQHASLNRRDGSDWAVYDCDETMHEGRQSARIVCTKEKDHNCDRLFLGGAKDTVVDMPSHCGPGKYALVVSVEPMHDAHEDDVLARAPHLKRRVPPSSRVFNLTFDYGFHRLQGRADNKMKIRIDYSNAKGYWDDVVAAAPSSSSNNKFRRTVPDGQDVHHIVQRDYKGDYKRFLDHSYRLDRRHTPDDQLHELHERWFGLDVPDWVSRLTKVNKNVDLLDQRVSKTFVYKIVDEKRTCPTGEFAADVHARISADVQTSGVLTLIGDLANMKEFRHSYINFRNKGEIQASLVFHAHGELRLPYMEDTILGIAPLGASFKIPGIVTIGPEFKLVASVEGRVAVDADARVDFDVAKWDYSQRYPADNEAHIDPDKDEPDTPTFATSNKQGNETIKFNWQVTAEGIIEMHLIPLVSFGIVFNPKWEVPSTAAELGVDTYLRVHGDAAVGGAQDFQACLASEAGYELYARITAPTLFGVDLNRRWSLYDDEVSIFRSPGCPNLESAARIRRGQDMLLVAPRAEVNPVVDGGSKLYGIY
ncbi:glycoside hydrolase family 18 protein [Canariomyces notabilis]|uniref:chitinase n=1 Tax=Canariomyces notabilis TaxID=2074819 RepID=A0AAN6T8S3_9PEZI|nr:glycoside hydrolase family 18 protein [Canariomyces arenarius]